MLELFKWFNNKKLSQTCSTNHLKLLVWLQAFERTLLGEKTMRVQISVFQSFCYLRWQFTTKLIWLQECMREESGKNRNLGFHYQWVQAVAGKVNHCQQEIPVDQMNMWKQVFRVESKLKKTWQIVVLHYHSGAQGVFSSRNG